MIRTRPPLVAVLVTAGLALPGLAQAVTLEMPFSAVPSVGKTETYSSYALPTAAFANGAVPSRIVEGPLRQTAWRIDAPGATTLELLMPLRAQLAELGFKTVFECETVACGGFDFRYGTLILPEPDMHVDLGDFRFYAAERADEVVSLMISRTANAGFVQMIHVGGAQEAAPLLTASSKASVLPPSEMAAATPLAAAPPVAAQGGSLAEQLVSGGAVVLEDLVFTSGSSTLVAGEYPSLDALAAWMRDNPTLRVALVGHTDASGGLEGNIALSRKRAEAVLQYLVQEERIPASRLEAQGVGYLAPRASNLTEDGRDKNRRVEVMVTSTQVAP